MTFRFMKSILETERKICTERAVKLINYSICGVIYSKFVGSA